MAHEDESDASLMGRAAGGDRAAFDVLSDPVRLPEYVPPLELEMFLDRLFERFHFNLP